MKKQQLWTCLIGLVVVAAIVAACAPVVQPTQVPAAQTTAIKPAESPVATAQETPLLFLGNKNIAPVIYLDGTTPSGVAVDLVRAAVKKGNTELLSAINKALQVIKADGTYQRNLSHWEPTEVVFETQQQATERTYLATTLILLILLLFAVIGMAAINQALTQRKAAEEKLREQYSTLRSIIDSTNALVFSVDRQYRYTSFNQSHATAMKTLYGAEIEMGRSLLGYMTVTEDREIAKRNLDQVLAGEQMMEEVYSGEELRSRRYFQISHSPIKSEEGQVIGVAVLAQDITGRKQLEMQLLESEERFRLLSESSLTGIYLIQKDGFHYIFRYVNPALARMFGYAVEELVDRCDPLDLVYPDDRHIVAENLGHRLEGEVEEAHYDFRGQRKDGSMVHIEVHGRRIEYGGTIGVLGTLVEITERKQVEEERLAHLRFIENLDQVNRAIQGTNDLEQMMRDMLDILLSVFDCDRAWLVYPCDPDTTSWQTPMERTRPEYPGVLPMGVELPLEPVGAEVFRILRNSSGPVQFGPGSKYQVPVEMAQSFRLQSFIAMAIYPKVGKPWSFGLHQCSYPRVWTLQEERLFQEIGRRLSDALSSLLTYRDLRESERRLTEAQRIAHIGYWERDFDTNRITLSNETCRIFGLSPQEFPLNLEQWHQRWLELIHPEDQPRTAQAAAEALRNGPPYNVEYRVVQPGGEIRFVHSEASVKRDESGRPRSMLGMMQDITERKRAEEALRESEERYRTLFNVMDQGVAINEIVRDEQGEVVDYIILEVNPAFTRNSVYTAADVVGRRATDLYKMRPKFIREWWKKHTQIQQVVHSEMYYEPTGRWFHITTTPPAGNRFATFSTDVTDRKRAEEQIRQLNQELEQRVLDRTAQLEAANKELEAFAYSISHDLRAPLRHIDGFLELLHRRTVGTLDERSRHYMTTISEAARRMGMLIDDLLAFSRMGRNEMAKTPVDLGSLVQETIREFTLETQGRSIHWRIGDLPTVIGDRAMLRLVLVNLLANALKFTRGRPQADIEIGCQAGEKETIIFIRDNGVGFDMAYAGKLFGVFQRLHRVDEFEGTGIGLANVRRIINRHGGRVWAEGQINQGATFYVSLPRYTQGSSTGAT